MLSLHEQLADESIALEIQARLAWIQLARERLNGKSEDDKQG